MIYYALIQGAGEGCDYTIACNKNYFVLKADNLSKARKELKEILKEEKPEEGWEEAIIIECNKIQLLIFEGERIAVKDQKNT